MSRRLFLSLAFVPALALAQPAPPAPPADGRKPDFVPCDPAHPERPCTPVPPAPPVQPADGRKPDYVPCDPA